LVNLLQVEQSFNEPSGDDASILAQAIEKSEGIIRVLRFFHRGCGKKMGLSNNEENELE
jgi:hypothetical protein